MKTKAALRFSLCMMCAAIPAANGADDTQKLPALAEDGILRVPGYAIPAPPRLSPEARQALNAMIRGSIARAKTPKPQTPPPAPADFAKIRADGVKDAAPGIARMATRYGVRMHDVAIGGVQCTDISPKDGIPSVNAGKVLMELHAGGFKYGSAADSGALEAIPLSARMSIRVIAVDYRQGPEHQFPAASQDVAAVYRMLLKRYKPENIGIFGSSAGGLLTAEAMAWFAREQLPMPGAIGILFASADARWDGDSIYSVPGSLGYGAPDPRAPRNYDEASYYGTTSLDDPLMSPINDRTVMAKFPPTLLLSATRADDMGSAVTTHRMLTELGVSAELQLWDGLWHCFHLSNPDLPESRAAHAVVADFFRRRLGGGGATAATPE